MGGGWGRFLQISFMSQLFSPYIQLQKDDIFEEPLSSLCPAFHSPPPLPQFPDPLTVDHSSLLCPFNLQTSISFLYSALFHVPYSPCS